MKYETAEKREQPEVTSEPIGSTYRKAWQDLTAQDVSEPVQEARGEEHRAHASQKEGGKTRHAHYSDPPSNSFPQSQESPRKSSWFVTLPSTSCRITFSWNWVQTC